MSLSPKTLNPDEHELGVMTKTDLAKAWGVAKGYIQALVDFGGLPEGTIMKMAVIKVVDANEWASRSCPELVAKADSVAAPKPEPGRYDLEDAVKNAEPVGEQNDPAVMAALSGGQVAA